MRLKLFLDKSVEQNAEVYFEKAKKAKQKLKGAQNALYKSLQKLKEIEKSRVIKQERIKAFGKKEWYEKFRWFFSSAGFLVVGGRDATTNEIIIKKHMENNDLVFHTDMAGSPFFIIKSEGKIIDEETIKEAAIATASFSRAWKLGIPSVDVFYVKPEQITKETRSGEFIQKGSFMVYGKKNYIKPELRLAIGSVENRIISGPVNAIKAQTKRFIVLEQGNQKPSDIAKDIKIRLQTKSVDDIIRMLPAGNLQII